MQVPRRDARARRAPEPEVDADLSGRNRLTCVDRSRGGWRLGIQVAALSTAGRARSPCAFRPRSRRRVVLQQAAELRTTIPVARLGCLACRQRLRACAPLAAAVRAARWGWRAQRCRELRGSGTHTRRGSSPASAASERAPFTFDGEAWHRGPVCFGMSVTWYAQRPGEAGATAPAPAIRAGERWRFTVRLKRPRGLANPHAFDFEPWALERGIRATGYVRAAPAPVRLEEHEPGWPQSLHRLRGDIRDSMREALGDARLPRLCARRATDAMPAVCNVLAPRGPPVSISPARTMLAPCFATLLLGCACRGRTRLPAPSLLGVAALPPTRSGGSGSRAAPCDVAPRPASGRSPFVAVAGVRRGRPRRPRRRSVGRALAGVLALLRRRGRHLPRLRAASPAAGRPARRGEDAGGGHARVVASARLALRRGLGGLARGQRVRDSAGEPGGRAAHAGRIAPPLRAPVPLNAIWRLRWCPGCFAFIRRSW